MLGFSYCLIPDAMSLQFPLTKSPPTVDRSLLIDGLKALAAQIIVIHHLVSYGPMAEAANMAFPSLVECSATMVDGLYKCFWCSQGISRRNRCAVKKQV